MVDQHQAHFPVTLTEAAKSHIANQLIKVDKQCFVLTVKDSGCNGFKYDFKLEKILPHNAISQFINDSLQFAVENSAVKYVSGTHIDYKVYEHGLGLKKLVFTNPNISGECGCGESFSVRD